MTHPLHESSIQISRVHRMAISKEIGEGLRTVLNHQSVELPSSLVRLMERLRDDHSDNSAKLGA